MAKLSGIVDPRHYENDVDFRPSQPLDNSELLQVDEVVVNKDFYARLIDIAHESFGRTSFSQIKTYLIDRLDNTRDLSNLVRETEEFIKERVFIDAVTAEKERIEYAKL